MQTLTIYVKKVCLVMYEIPCIDVDQKFTLHFIVYCKQVEGFRV